MLGEYWRRNTRVMGLRSAKQKCKSAGVILCVVLLGGTLVFQIFLGNSWSSAQASTPISTNASDVDSIGGCTVNCPPTTPPVLKGWGGVRLEDSGADLESHIQLFQALGYNAFRVSFASPCSVPQQEGSYSAASLQTAIGLARKYDFWIIIDMHGYYDIYPRNLPCWLMSWKTIVQQFNGSYSQIIWEPENEPQSNYYGDQEGVSLVQLSAGYQAWINQDRSLGDKHWIVVANGCISTCESTASVAATMWPAVNDTARRVFINWHFYMYYPYWSAQGTGWNNATADLAATSYFNLLVSGMRSTDWPAINTEGGADYIQGCPPDIVLGPCNARSGTGRGTCDGYTLTTLHFVQKLISLYESNVPSISWVGWPAGSWSTNVCNPPLGVSYGVLQSASGSFPGGWATKLTQSKLPGDVNHDNKVDILDAALVAFAYGSRPGEPRWNPSADLDYDGIVDIKDTAIIALYYGTSA